MIRTQHLNSTGLRGIKYLSDSGGRREIKQPVSQKSSFLLCKEVELIHVY